MADITKEDVIEFIANMSVLELSEMVKEMEEKFKKLYSERGKNTKELQSIINVHIRTRRDKLDLYVETLINFKSLITDEEWKNMVVNILQRQLEK